MFEIGNSLREARLRRGIDYAQAEVATKIRSKYLRALEEEQFEILPAETYVKGFLRTYADYLGLDGQLYVDEFNARFVAGERDLRPRRSRAKPRRSHRFEAGVVIAALAAIVVLAVVVIAAWSSSGGGKSPKSSAPPIRTVTKTVHPPLLTIVPLHGTTHLTVRKGSASGDIAFDGTLLRTDAPVAIRGTRLWVQITSPENVRVLIEGRARRIPGHAPRVMIVTPLGWQP